MTPGLVEVSVRRIEAREVCDLDALYRAHAPSVARWAARLAGPGLDVEDLVHDVFIVVERRIGGFRGDSSVRTWLYGVTANVVRQARRKRRVWQWLGLDEGVELRSWGRTPAEDAEQRDDIRRVYRALDRLTEAQRSVLVLFELEGLSGEEISTLTGIKLATVWVRLHRARAAFLDALERDTPGPAR